MFKSMNWYALIWAIFLVGCNGGASLAPEGSSDGDGTGGVSTTKSVAVALFSCESFDFSNPDLTAVNADSQPLCHGTTKVEDEMVTVVRVLATEDGAGVANGEVTLTPTDATLSTSSLLTRADGYGYVQLETTSTSGLVKVTARYDDAEETVTASLPVRTLSLSLFSCDSFDLSAPNVDSCAGTEDVYDNKINVVRVQTLADGSPAEDQLVTISSKEGSLSDSNGKVLTDENGFGYLTLSPDTSTGLASVEAEYMGEQELIYITMYGDDSGSGGAVAVNSVSVALYQCTSFDSSSPALDACSPTLEVRDVPTTIAVARALINGVPSANQKITVAADKGILSVADGTVLTNSEGFAYLTVGAAQDTGVVTVTASFEDASQAEALATIYGQPATSTQQLTLSVWDKDCPPGDVGCVAIENISSAETAIVLVEATESLQPAEKVLVSVQSNKGSLSPSDGVVLTDENGQAQLELTTGNSGGVISLDAIYESATATYNATIDQVELEVTLTSSPVLAADDELGKNQTLALVAQLTTNNGANPYELPVNVQFSSTCTSSGNAELSESVVAVSGSATAVYKPKDGCVQEDTIKAEVVLGGKVSSSTLTINIAETPVDSIVFESATPETIALRGSGEDTTSQLTFVIVDEEGDSKPNINVDFQLAAGPEDLSINQVEAISDAEGKVTVTVKAGNLPGAYRVRATVRNSDPLITAVSNKLTVAGGLPDSNSFNMALEVMNPDAWNWVNESVKVTAVAADHFNNPVSDGTVVYFTAEHGRIEDSCQTENGTCSVTWSSHGDTEAVPGSQPQDARVTIMAVVEGEESYWDNNGDNQYSVGIDTFNAPTHDLGEAFRDDNENFVYDPNGGTEQLRDRDGNGVFTAADGIFNGQSCDLATGSCNNDLVEISSSQVLVLSGGGKSTVTYCDNTANCRGGMPGGTGQPAAINENVVYVCAWDLAPDGSINVVPANSTITFKGLGDKLKILGESSFTQGNTNEAIYHTSIGIGNVGVDQRSTCGGQDAGFYAIGLDRSEMVGPETLQVVLDTPKSSKVLNNITVNP